MKILLTFFVLFFSSSVFAEDISDLQIEGISIGDSLLDYFSEDEIISNTFNYYNNKTYSPVQIKKSFYETYDEMSFNYKTNDNNFIISGISGTIDIDNDMEKCEKLKDEILKDIKSLFPKKTFKNSEGKHSADPSGNSIFKMQSMKLDNGNKIVITCYDYSKKSGWQDHLSVSIRTKHYDDFLDYAYD